jgi:hypothetical protein
VCITWIILPILIVFFFFFFVLQVQLAADELWAQHARVRRSGTHAPLHVGPVPIPIPLHPPFFTPNTPLGAVPLGLLLCLQQGL